MYSDRDHENNQSTHIFICMKHTKTEKLLPTKILKAAYLLLLLFKPQKKQMFCLSFHMGQKTPLVAWVYYFVFTCTCFWLNVNRYTFVGHSPLPFFKIPATLTVGIIVKKRISSFCIYANTQMWKQRQHNSTQPYDCLITTHNNTRYQKVIRCSDTP